jgi:Acetyltransferase (GNAT) domain
MTTEFRYLKFGEFHRVGRFLNEYWAKGHVYARMPQLFDWTFSRRTGWDREEYSFAVAEDKGEIVGILGAIPFVFNCLGRRSRAVWLVNYMVRPDYRQGPIALRLLGMFGPDHFDVTATAGLNPGLIPLLKALRWQLLEDFPRHFLVLPRAVERMVELLRLAYPDWQADRANTLARFFEWRGVFETALPCEKRVPPGWDRLDWPQIASRTIGAVRDLDYLTWRYLEHPCFKYQFIALPEEERTGLAVWRLETIHMATPRGLEEVDRIGRLVEFLPVSEHNAKNLLSLFVQELHNANAFAADYYGYHGETRAWLRKFGFHGVDGHPDGQTIPTRFQPLDQHGGRLISAVLVGNETPVCSMAADSLWYWTKSDGDQDRPN